MAEGFYNQLADEKTPIGDRYKAIFELKNLQTPEAVQLMLKSFDSLGSSELLKHELVYTLGQLNESRYPQLKEFLFQKVDDASQPRLVRHEAAEAIANYFDPASIDLYKKHENSEVEYLAMTCQVALYKVTHDSERRELYGQKYNGTREPIAAFSQQQFQKFLEEKELVEEYVKSGALPILCNPKLTLVDKYRVLYLLRDIADEQSKLVLCQLLSRSHFKSQPALFKHEVCFVLGQIGLGKGIQEKLLRECIENDEEEDIVRHEALAAAASQSSDEQYLQKFAEHPCPIIRESAQVAIYEIKYWHD